MIPENSSRGKKGGHYSSGFWGLTKTPAYSIVPKLFIEKGKKI
jgi:hypothetical protein